MFASAPEMTPSIAFQFANVTNTRSSLVTVWLFW